MKLVSTFAATITVLAMAASAHAGIPKCNQAGNKAAATKAFRAAIADAKNPVRVAYEQFLTAHDDGVQSRYSTVAPGNGKAPELYRKPVENKWVTILPTGTSRGTEGESKDDASETCVDEYLAIVAVPVEYKWGGEHLYFEAWIHVSTGAKGRGVPDIRHLQVTPDNESPPAPSK